MNKIEQKATRKEPTYKAYRVTSSGHATKIIFAAGIWSAVGVLLKWRAANGIGEVEFNLDPQWALTLQGVARQHIDDARRSCRGPRIGTMHRADLGWGLADPLFNADPPD